MERWDPEDRAIVSAVALEKSLVCHMCGTASYEWEQDPFAYQPMHITCVGCQKKELLSKDDTPTPAGTSVRLLPKATAERLTAEHERKKAEGVSDRPVRRRNRV